MSLLLGRCVGSVSAGPQLALAEGREAAARGERDRAIAYFEQALAQDSKLAQAHRWLSRLYAEKGVLEKALDSAAASVLLDPDPVDQRYVGRILDLGFPRSLGQHTPEALALPMTKIMIEAGDDRLAVDPGPWQALLIVDPDRETRSADPRFGWEFDRACHGYILDPASGRWQAALVVHYNAAAGAERRELAVKCAGLLLRAACLHKAYLGPDIRSASLRRPISVWLAEQGMPGAESWGRDIYLCEAATARAPAEWVRQVLHEYGHVALPGIDHFRDPERWANGRLGEHLFSRWLLRSREHGERHPWLEIADLNPLAADADRCVKVFVQRGPASPLADDRTTAGMDYYLGFANYIEQAFGPRVLSSAMRLTAGITCRAFVVGAQQALRGESATGVEMRALQSAGQMRLRQWVYMPAGRWIATCDAPSGGVAFNGHPIATSESDIGLVAEGWHSIALPPQTTVTLTRASR